MHRFPILGVRFPIMDRHRTTPCFKVVYIRLVINKKFLRRTMNIITKASKVIAQAGTGAAINWELVGTFKVANSIELHRVIDGVMTGTPLTEREGDLVRKVKWAELDLLAAWEAKQPKTKAPKNSESLESFTKGLTTKQKAELKKLLA